jgi:two-component system nitrogen regulation sensor histidine kinase NtrY
VTLEITDDGCGLAPEIRTKIFEPYFSTKENGTGLGLTIVSQIIEDHRGYIRAWPNEPKGSRFTIEFPVSASAAGNEEIAQKAAQS